MRLLAVFWLGYLVDASRSLDAKGCEFLAILCRENGFCGDFFKDTYVDCLKLHRANRQRKEWLLKRAIPPSDSWGSDEYIPDTELEDVAQRIHKLSGNTDSSAHQRPYELFDEFTHSRDFDKFLDQYKPRRALNFHDGSKEKPSTHKNLASNDEIIDTNKQEDFPPSKEVIDNVVTSDLVDYEKSNQPNSPGLGKSSGVSGKQDNSHDSQQVNAAQSDDSQQSQGVLTLTVSKPLSTAKAVSFGAGLQNVLWSLSATTHKVFVNISSGGDKVTLHMVTAPAWFKFGDNAADVARRLNSNADLRSKIATATGVTIVNATSAGVVASLYSHAHSAPVQTWNNFALLAAVIGGSVLGLLCAALIVCGVKRYKGNEDKLISLKQDEATSDYQELCRTQMSLHGSSVAGLSDTPENQEKGLVGGLGKVAKKSWGEEPTAVNMDISTGHVVLAYMEDHLSNQDRLKREWEALCSYKPDSVSANAGNSSRVLQKNRYQDVLPYDHTRVKLKTASNSSNSDYINASFVTDIDPRYPAYIATQGPLDNTVADFWQMVWEQGVVVIVNLTQLSDMGLPQCHRYWPEDGSEIYHNFEVHLISEHIWCDDYLVRSFYLKNLQTGETRTVTQFHFLTWQDLSVPESPRPLLEFRRKVNKCYKGQSCPIIIHCNNGVGRTGTYILIDMVLNKMIKGAKEIDIAATLEHIRDQRPDMVKTKSQFEFALAAVAEEVTAILNSLPQ